MKFAIQPSSQICPIDTRYPDRRWGDIWYVRAAWVNMGFRFSITLWVA